MLKKALRLLFCGFVLFFLMPIMGYTKENPRYFKIPGFCYDTELFTDEYQTPRSDYQDLRTDFFTFKFLKPWTQVPKVNILGDEKTNDPSVVESYAFKNLETGGLFRISVIDLGKPFIEDDYFKYTHKIAKELAQKGVELRKFRFYGEEVYGFYGRVESKILFVRLHGFEHYLVFVDGLYQGTQDDYAVLERNIYYLK